MESRTLVFVTAVVLTTLLALSNATIECYSCSGTGSVEPCGHGALFKTSGTGVSTLNCTSCLKQVTSVSGVDGIVRGCSNTATAGTSCSNGICQYICTAADCNHSTVPRYAFPAIVVALVVSVLAKFSQK